METADALAPFPDWLMEPGYSLGPRYQPFSIPDNAMYDMCEEPHRSGFHTSSARDEPIPTPRSTTERQLEAPLEKSHDVKEADRLSREYFEVIFANNDAEVAEAPARLSRYTQFKRPQLYPLRTGVSIKDSKRIFQDAPSTSTKHIVSRLLSIDAPLVFNSNFPPVDRLLKTLEQHPDLLQVVAGNGRNVREWTSSELPQWYTRVLEDKRVNFIDRVCFVTAALWAYNNKTHPAHRIFWSSLTCRAQSGADDKQAVWERSVEMIRDLLALGEDSPIDRADCAKLMDDLAGLHTLSGAKLHKRIKYLFPTRWLPELGATVGLGREGSPTAKKRNGRPVNATAAPGISHRKKTPVDVVTAEARLQTKKRKAEALSDTDTEQSPDTRDIPAASPRKSARVVTFAEPLRKSSRVKTKAPVHARGDAVRSVAHVSKRVKLATITSVPKKANPSSQNNVAPDTTKTKLELIDVKTVAAPHLSTSDTLSITMRPKRSPPKRKANATVLPSASGSEAPSNSPSATLMTPLSLSPSNPAAMGSPGSSTAVSPMSDHSRGSSTSARTAVGSPMADLKEGKGKRKRVCESRDTGMKEADGAGEQVEKVVVPRRTTRTLKTMAKAAVATSNTKPVEDENLTRKRRKTTKSSQKV